MLQMYIINSCYYILSIVEVNYFDCGFVLVLLTSLGII